MNMTTLRKKATHFALPMAFSVLFQTFFPTISYALTSGPTQPEASGFTPIGVSDLVDPFTGDFSYNIPLFDIGGYPINMSYQAGARMDDEASWVGLGWTLNPGLINRNMRGVPDDFNGDEVVKEYSMKPDQTWSISLAPDLQIGGKTKLKKLGIDKISGFTLGLYHNNYKGFGLTVGLTPALLGTNANKGPFTGGLGLSLDSQTGVSLNPNIGMSKRVGILNFDLNFSASINSVKSHAGLTLASSAGYDIRKKTIGARLTNGNMSFGEQTYFPTNSLPMANRTTAFHLTLGGELLVAHGNLKISGSGSKQSLALNKTAQKSYGYLNMQNAGLLDVLDFNRERVGLPYRKNMATLPSGFGTFDIFNVNAHGLSSQFRSHRGDLGSFYGDQNKTFANSNTVGIELGGLPNLAHVGADVTIVKSSSQSSKWEKDENNLFDSKIKFTSLTGNTLYENSFLKSNGERTIANSNFQDDFGGEKVTRIKLEEFSKYNVGTKNKFLVNSEILNSSELLAGSTIQRNERDKRNESISALTFREARQLGLNKKNHSYKMNEKRVSGCCGDDCGIDTEQSFQSPADHHIREISVNKTDGMRYVFGVPTYNYVQKEVSFSVNKTDGINDGLVKYDLDDNSLNNKKGIDHHFSSTSIPPYATGYLLSGVLSPDYIDRTGNGITEDDYGSAVRFNYTRLQDLYKWKTPYSRGGDKVRIARHQKGHLTVADDDKASYSYGEKEVWYTHSIESKTLLAQFYLSDREDGCGVDGEFETSSTASARLQKLDKIEIYSKSDLLKNEAPTPIKVVHFEYDYSLCENVYNNTGANVDKDGNTLLSSTDPNNVNNKKGKLTLKKVYFTYGASDKGESNPYEFEYNTGISGTSVAYNTQKSDRWGVYKDHPAGYAEYDFFPYSLQHDPNINEYAGLFSMKEITLPSGGIITIDYESDDYAYVQDSRAGQMFFVEGFGGANVNNPSSFTDKLYKNINVYDINEYMFVNVEGANLNTNLSQDELEQRFFGGRDKVYFNMLVDLSNGNNKEEYVKGYANVNPLLPIKTLTSAGKLTHIGIPIRPFGDDPLKPIHPVTKAAFQLMRLELPHLVYPGYRDYSDSHGVAFLKKFAGLAKSIVQMITAFDNTNLVAKKARKVNVSNASWVRLASPTFSKKGGGHRVKSVKISDNWKAMAGTNHNDLVQGWEYEYTQNKTLVVDGSEKQITISSGVAAYEPGIGNDENYYRKPYIADKDQSYLRPDNFYYIDKPVGEALFPAPTVGYSKVNVKSIYSGTGWTTHEFYTAKDFPVITEYTEPDAKSASEKGIKSLLKFSIRDYLTMSQGFKVEVNDMHGKQKAVSTYAENGEAISSTLYKYQTKLSDKGATVLDSEVYTISPSGVLETSKVKLGVDIDIWNDFREEESNSSTTGVGGNLEGFSVPYPPFYIPIPFGRFNKRKEHTRFRSAVSTKFIKRQGILAEVIVTQDGSEVSTKNNYYDSETGDVLLTETTNEFNDPIFQFKYPAHWAYDGLSQAYKNQGASFKDVTIVNGIPTNIPNYASMFTEGDWVGFGFGGRWHRNLLNAYFDNSTIPKLRLYDKYGKPFNTVIDLDLKIVRSGRKNMAMNPIGSVTFLQTPPTGVTTPIDVFLNSGNAKIVDASVSTYKDEWPRECACASDAPIDNNPINPYRFGMKGNWRTNDNYVNYRNRSAFVNANNSNYDYSKTRIQDDGINELFKPFWAKSGSVWDEQDPIADGWVSQSKPTLFDRNGNGLEEVNALGIYSSAIFGYKNSLATAVANNAKYNEIVFDGFEDYCFDISNCCDVTESCNYRNFNAFSLSIDESNPDVELSTDEAHTGKYSIKVAPNKTAESYNECNNSTNNDILSWNTANTNYIPGGKTCIPTFLDQHTSSKRFLVSAWVKLAMPSTPATAAELPKINVIRDGSSQSINTELSSPIIEGWQRIQGEVLMSANITTLEIELINQSGSSDAYFDDIRIFPWEGNMQSFVYDPISQRLMATLDENNYATFYEYNEEGHLIRQKRETEEGIITLQENRTVLRPKS